MQARNAGVPEAQAAAAGQQQEDPVQATDPGRDQGHARIAVAEGQWLPAIGAEQHPQRSRKVHYSTIRRAIGSSVGIDTARQQQGCHAGMLNGPSRWPGSSDQPTRGVDEQAGRWQKAAKKATAKHS